MKFRKTLAVLAVSTLIAAAGCGGNSVGVSSGMSGSSGASSQGQEADSSSAGQQSNEDAAPQSVNSSGAEGTGSQNSSGAYTSVQADNESSADAESDSSPEELAASNFDDLSHFTATTLDGETFTQGDLADSDVTVINCWSTTCGYCLSELPVLARFNKSLPSNVKVITLCLDGEYSPDAAKQILDTAGYEGITLVSGDGDLSDMLSEIMYTPTTVLVDSQGKMEGHEIVGYDKNYASSLTDEINAVLTGMGKQGI